MFFLALITMNCPTAASISRKTGDLFWLCIHFDRPMVRSGSPFSAESSKVSSSCAVGSCVGVNTRSGGVVNPAKASNVGTTARAITSVDASGGTAVPAAGRNRSF